MRPSGERLPPIQVPGRTQVEFARVLEGGRLLCLSVDEGITLLGPGGDLVFHTDLPAHHDAVVVPDGAAPGHRTFAVLVHREHVYRGRRTRFDGIALISEATGEMISSKEIPAAWAWDSFAHRASLMKAIDGPPHALDGAPRAPSKDAGQVYDYFHANALAFEGSSKLTVCLRNVDAIVSLTWPSGEPASAFGPGLLDWPHAPSFVDRGLLIFDNGKHRGWSRVIEVSPDGGQVHWEWRGSEERPLWSKVRGFAQRLPNGNTLVTESERGRALEVTPDGSIVWELLNPETRRDRRGQTARRRVYRVMAFPRAWIADMPTESPSRAESASGEDPAEPPR